VKTLVSLSKVLQEPDMADIRNWDLAGQSLVKSRKFEKLNVKSQTLKKLVKELSVIARVECGHNRANVCIDKEIFNADRLVVHCDVRHCDRIRCSVVQHSRNPIPEL